MPLRVGKKFQANSTGRSSVEMPAIYSHSTLDPGGVRVTSMDRTRNVVVPDSSLKPWASVIQAVSPVVGGCGPLATMQRSTPGTARH